MNKNINSKFIIGAGLLLLAAPFLLSIIDPLYHWYIFYTFVPGVLLVIIGTVASLLESRKHKKDLTSNLVSIKESKKKTYSLINNLVIGFLLLATPFITYWFVSNVL